MTIAQTIVEQTTKIVSEQINLESLMDGSFDAWSFADSRRVIHLMATHLNKYANGRAYLNCISIGDPRGQWYGVFNGGMGTAARPEDPGTFSQLEALYRTAEGRPINFYRPYTRETINSLPSKIGVFSEDGCPQENERCDWPTWENCDDDTCSSQTCCFTDSIYIENSPIASDESKVDQITWLQQYDPRVRDWYINSAEQYARSRQRVGWSEVYATAGSGGGLVFSGTLVIPDASGGSGTDASRGKLTAGVYHGHDFTGGNAETLVILVDGAPQNIVLNMDLSSAQDTATVIDAGLGNVGSAGLSADGFITIESATTGPTSMVEVSCSSGLAAQSMISLSAATAVTGAVATVGSYIGQRVPHSGNSQRISANSLKRLRRRFKSRDPTWTGFDFRNTPEDLIIEIDGVGHTIALTTDLTNIDDSVDGRCCHYVPLQ
jgi:hypothetical protein